MTTTRRTQAERSATTRAALLEATIACLVERGYGGTSTPEVCRRAGVSRGAQLHHFPTRASLLAAAVEHLFERRHAEFRASLADAQGEARLSAALGALWEIYRGETLEAWLELVIASRSDPELHAAVAGVNERFLAAAGETFASLFAGSSDAASAEARVGVRLITALFDGLALGRIVEDDPDLIRATLQRFGELLRPWLEEIP
ncbi:MAG: TetR/AcrR family transcriptional regulator [Planctomycetota bacterium]